MIHGRNSYVQKRAYALAEVFLVLHLGRHHRDNRLLHPQRADRLELLALLSHSLVLSVLWNFTLNRRYTFQSANNVPLAMAQVLGFYCVFTPASTLLGNYLADTLLWNEYLVTAMNMAANFILEYLYDRFVVFRKSLDTNSIAKKHAVQ